MRILIVDADPARAALVAEGLAGLEPLEVRCAAAYGREEAARFQPDAVVLSADFPDPDTMESLRAASADPRPVVMFVGRSGPGRAEAAVRAGVSAYVVDGLTPARVRPVLEAAISRFRLVSELRRDLEKARTDLAARKLVERAKAMLMKERGLDEAAAYGLLRKLSMDTGRPLAAVALDLLALGDALKGPDR